MRLRALFHVKHWLQSKLPYAPILALLCHARIRPMAGSLSFRLRQKLICFADPVFLPSLQSKLPYVPILALLPSMEFASRL